ncbi:GrxA family glutaredoxin [Moritella viscosa]|uniref:GrxA family glutaredoxin n=1 Tax=Moritella viscosa TaxID=80854 RepID=UPI00091604CD|nr:GrxA family glutaredoxin [Moritella viscosa]SGY91885.1 Glutaredoxin 1 [Moritella viscosa]
MFTVIFGRPGCPFCVRAKQIAETLKAEHENFDFNYIDMLAEGISKADLEKSAGVPVNTVPQIFIDEKHLGGCTEFEQYAKENLGLYA